MQAFFADEPVRVIYGAMRDKAIDEVTNALFPLATEVVITEPRTPRAISASQLAEIASHHAQHSTTIIDAEKALDHALASAHSEDVIFVTGSLYLVGQIRAYGKSRAQVAAKSKTP